ncbi:hypothetical protein [Rhodopseudomonas sp. RCAM05734]|uniref:hypothetical protein n=1 Tax=Rhodopseudomonas sp. RCAM05734 TaxID=3457549 RepID=UPI004043C77F
MLQIAKVEHALAWARARIGQGPVLIAKLLPLKSGNFAGPGFVEDALRLMK